MKDLVEAAAEEVEAAVAAEVAAAAEEAAAEVAAAVAAADQPAEEADFAVNGAGAEDAGADVQWILGSLLSAEISVSASQ